MFLNLEARALARISVIRPSSTRTFLLMALKYRLDHDVGYLKLDITSPEEQTLKFGHVGSEEDQGRGADFNKLDYLLVIRV